MRKITLSDRAVNVIILLSAVAIVAFYVIYSNSRIALQSGWVMRERQGACFLVEKSAIEGGAEKLDAAIDGAFAFLRTALGRDPAGFLPKDLIVVATYGGYGGFSLSDGIVERTLRQRDRVQALRLAAPFKMKYAPNEPLGAGRMFRDERIIFIDLYDAESNGDDARIALVHALCDFIIEWNVPSVVSVRLEPGVSYSKEGRRDFYLSREFFSQYLAQRAKLADAGAADLAGNYRRLLDERYDPEGQLFGGGNLRAFYAEEADELGFLVKNHYAAVATLESSGEDAILAGFRGMAEGNYTNPRELAASLGAKFEDAAGSPK